MAELEEQQLYERAVGLLVLERRASTSFLQRKLVISYKRAATLMLRAEAEGVVSECNHVGKREVLFAKPENEEAALKLEGNHMSQKKTSATDCSGPRITQEMIDREIVDEDYHVFPRTQLTICALTLRNGFTVTGESACADPGNFDAEIGRRIAASNAREKIWPLLGFRLKDQLAGGKGAV